MIEMSDMIRDSLKLYGPSLSKQNRLSLCVDHYCPKSSVKKQDSLLGVILVIRYLDMSHTIWSILIII